MIRFHTKEKKGLEVLLYVLGELPEAKFNLLGKILYVAEKEHLLNYGRPIYGDSYIAGSDGPVPLFIKDVIEGNYLFSSIYFKLPQSHKIL